jgi:hypothetical protein
MEGNISLNIRPMERMIPDVKMVNERLSPLTSCFLKNNNFKILKETKMMTTETTIDKMISINDNEKSFEFIIFYLLVSIIFQ